jgi:hypothetical protein
MSIHVVIPTLQGLSNVLCLTQEDPDVPSVVCLNGTAQSLPISNAYYDFVRRGQGLLAKDFGHESWRLDLSDPIEMGDSWQLAVYIAHYLESKGELGNGRPKPGDTVIWATGSVRIDRSVESVDGVPRKLSHSQHVFEQWAEQGITVLAVMNQENRASVTLPQTCTDIVLDDVSDLSELLRYLPAIQHTADTKSSSDGKGAMSKWLILGAFIALGLGAGVYSQYPNGTHIDDTTQNSTFQQQVLAEVPSTKVIPIEPKVKPTVAVSETEAKDSSLKKVALEKSNTLDSEGVEREVLRVSQASTEITQAHREITQEPNTTSVSINSLIEKDSGITLVAQNSAQSNTQNRANNCSGDEAFQPINRLENGWHKNQAGLGQYCQKDQTSDRKALILVMKHELPMDAASNLERFLKAQITMDDTVQSAREKLLTGKTSLIGVEGLIWSKK